MKKLWFVVPIFVWAFLLLAGQNRMSGNTFYAETIDVGTSDSFRVGATRWFYGLRKFYFNSTNSLTQVDYNGYSGLSLTATVHKGASTTTIDSCYAVGFMLDAFGHRNPETDSLNIFGPITITEGDTLFYRLDNISDVYSVQSGIEIKFKRQTATNTDSATVKLAVLFN